MRNRTLARRAITAIKQGIAFLYRSDFCVDEAAPIDTPFSSDIGSDLTIVQVDGNIGLSGGAMDIPAQGTPVSGDLGFFSVDSFTRENGLVALFSLNFGTLDDAALGFLDAQDALIASYDNIGVSINGTALEARFTSDANSPDIFTLSSSTDYVIALVLRASGRFIYLLDGTNWLLLWPDEEDSTATLFLGYANLSSVVALDTVRVRQLSTILFVPDVELIGALLTGDGSVSGGDPAFSDGDSVILMTLSEAPTGGNLVNFNVRHRDVTQFWQLRISATAYTLEEDGSTTRATGSATPTATDILVFKLFDDTITLYVNNVEDLTYASAILSPREADWSVEYTGGDGELSDVDQWKAYARNEADLDSELVINGDFSTDTDWIKGTGWSIAAGVASCDGTQAGNSNLDASVNPLTAGTLYEVSFTLSNRVSGNIRLRIGTGNAQDSETVNATYTYQVRAVTDGLLRLIANASFVGDIDNVTAKEILFTLDDLGKNLNQSLLGDCVGAGFSSGFSDGFS